MAGCVRRHTGMPRCHSAAPMQNEESGPGQGGLLRSGRNYVFALCGPLQQRRRLQCSADTGEASMGDGRDKIRWPLSMPSHDQWAATPPEWQVEAMVRCARGHLPQARVSIATFATLFREIWARFERNSAKFGPFPPKFCCEQNLGAFQTNETLA